MDTLLEKVYQAQTYAGITTGLGLSCSVIRRRLLEASTPGEKELLLKSLGDIVDLIELAKANISTDLKN